MVNYELGVRNNGYSISFDLSKLIPNKKDKNIYEIDKLTGEFESEESLKKSLISSGVMPDELYKDGLSIVYKNTKTLPVVFKAQKIYIDRLLYLASRFKKYISINDPNFRSLVGYFPELTKMLKNRKFLEELVNEYRYVPIHSQNILELEVYLSKPNLDPNDIIANLALFDLLRRILLKKDKNSQEINYIVNYRGLRDLGIIIYKYNERVRLMKLREQLKREQAEAGAASIIPSSKDAKWVLSSEGDPDFPFNSEEETSYKELLENLPDEEHPHYRR